MDFSIIRLNLTNHGYTETFSLGSILCLCCFYALVKFRHKNPLGKHLEKITFSLEIPAVAATNIAGDALPFHAWVC